MPLYLQVWTVVRQIDTGHQNISAWTGFNIPTRSNVCITPDNIGYLPTINAPATELTTVHEVLKQCLAIRNTLDLKSIVCVFDQAIS